MGEETSASGNAQRHELAQGGALDVISEHDKSGSDGVSMAKWMQASVGKSRTDQQLPRIIGRSTQCCSVADNGMQ